MNEQALKFIAKYLKKSNYKALRLVDRSFNEIFASLVLGFITLSYKGALINELILDDYSYGIFNDHLDEFKDSFANYSLSLKEIKLSPYAQFALQSDIFIQFSGITTLNIHSCKTDERAVLLALSSLRKLRSLILCNVIIKQELGLEINIDLPTEKTLFKLVLQKVSVRSKDSKLVNYLHTINSVNNLTFTGLENDFLLKPFEFDKDLRSLTVHFNNSFSSISILEKILESNKKVSSLTILLNKINQEAANILTKHLPYAKELQLKSLSDNCLNQFEAVTIPMPFWDKELYIKKLSLALHILTKLSLNRLLICLPCVEELEISFGDDIPNLSEPLSNSCPNIIALVLRYIQNSSSNVENQAFNDVSKVFETNSHYPTYLCENKLNSLTLININSVDYINLYNSLFRSLRIINFYQVFEQDITRCQKAEITNKFNNANFYYYKKIFDRNKLIGYVCRPKVECMAYTFEE